MTTNDPSKPPLSDAIYTGTVESRLSRLSNRLPGIEHVPTTARRWTGPCADQLTLDEVPD